MLLQISCSKKAEAYIACGLAMFHFFLFDDADVEFKPRQTRMVAVSDIIQFLQLTEAGRTPHLVSFCGLLRCRKQLARE